MTSTLWSAPSATTVSADLAGDGAKVLCKLEIKKEAGDDDHFIEATLKVGSESHPMGEEFMGYECELKAYSISGDTKQKVLVASAFSESDYVRRHFFTLVNGKLKELGFLEGQGDITVPGNGTVISTSWMGFWSRTEKHVFGPDLTLAPLAQEFYSVNVEGTVTKSFPVYQTRSTKVLLANTRKGSKFQVILWDPASRKVVNDEENLNDQWYLIRTESGFVGWVRGESLQYENSELPWAG